MAFIYRFANNPYINRLIQNLRGNAYAYSFEKSPSGTVKFFRQLKKGNSCGLLIDQKLNSGMELDFLGKAAKTQTIVPELAKRFDLIIIPVRVIRYDKYYHKLEFGNAINYKEFSEDKNLIQEINNVISAWIEKTPEQWFWLHDRWGLKKRKKRGG